MKVIVVASPRSGSTSIFEYANKLKERNNTITYDEPFNKSYYCVGESFLYKNVIKNKNIFVKTISDQIPPEFTDNVDLFYETLKKDFDRIVFLERKDLEKQIESLSHAVRTNRWHEKYFYEKNIYKDIDNTRIENLLKIKEIINCRYFPYVIKDMGKENKKFVEKEFEKFLDNL